MAHKEAGPSFVRGSRPEHYESDANVFVKFWTHIGDLYIQSEN